MKPAVAESSRAVIRRITPVSFIRRTRLSVAAGLRPDDPGQLDVGAVGVGLELPEQSDVDFV